VVALPVVCTSRVVVVCVNVLNLEDTTGVQVRSQVKFTWGPKIQNVKLLSKTLSEQLASNKRRERCSIF
jgi:hypothetical protein